MEKKRQQASLLNFFSKSPKVSTTPKSGKGGAEKKDDEGKDDNADRGRNGSSPELKRKSSSSVTSSKPGGGGGVAVDSAASGVDGDRCPGDVVWARLEGYPWWPSMICPDPSAAAARGGSGASSSHSRLGKIHVQFFDETSSHAWVKRSAVADFKDRAQGEWGGEFWCRDPKAKRGAETAEAALAVRDRRERLDRFLAELHDESAEAEAEALEDDDDDGDDDRVNGDNDAEEEKENVKMDAEEGAASKKRRREEKEDSPPAKRNINNHNNNDKNNKRRRIVQRLDSSDEEEGTKVQGGKSDDEFRPPKAHSDDESDDVDDEEEEEEDGISDESLSSEEGLDDIKQRFGQKKKKGKKTAGSKPVKKTAAEMKKPAMNNKSAPAPSTPKPSTPASKASTPASKASTPAAVRSKLSQFAAPGEGDDGAASTTAGEDDGISFKHEGYEFLKPEKIRDAQRRRPADPDYDPRTLHVPAEFLAQQTPAQRQWWEFKAKHFDTILFFKQGKFYELYHTDCVTAVKECGLAYMKGDHAHCGFPEKAGPRYAEALIQKGYAVARIEQTETPDMMQERVKGMNRPTKFDKVVRREICAITTKATRRFGYMDKEASDDKAAYLLAICEKEMPADGGDEDHDGDGKPRCHYGIAFVDVAVGKFVVGQFVDDRLSSRLRTLLAHWPPAQILYGKGDKMLTPKSLRLLKASCPSAIMTTPLVAGKEFWEAEKTLKTLAESDYFRDETSKEMVWPAELKKACLAETDALGLTPKPGRELAVRSLGALVWYLSQCVIDHELLSMKLFEIYQPLDVGGAAGGRREAVVDDKDDEEGKPREETDDERYIAHCKFMVLDGLTVNNLDIFSVDGNLEGSLLARIDRASTPFGKRLLREWLAAPLCDLKAIRNRQDAVDDLIENRDLLEEAGGAMKKLPDLERLLSRIHAMGSATRHANHPDGRAVIFEADIFDRKKIEDFIKILEGYEKALGVVETFRKARESLGCDRLRDLTTFVSEGGSFPDLDDDLRQFAAMFDREKARRDGVIESAPGVDAEFDEAVAGVEAAKKALNEYRRREEKHLECAVTFYHQGKTTYQLEIPEKKKVPAKYRLVSSKKGFKRYHTDDVVSLRDDLNEAERHRDELVKATSRKVFRKFDENARAWTRACRNLATLDALCSLAKFSVEGCGGEMVRPDFIAASSHPGGRPFIEIRDGVHPTIGATFSGDDYIPNDIVIGVDADNNDEDGEDSCSSSDAASTVLVTGPNMGGKSTLMRQAATLVILAQLGCRVPASKCRLTPVDRIFTRLGARDNIVGGESTFFVEMSETTSILRHATRHSLVLVDELGRGTSTYDGTAVASAVVKEIVEAKKCRCLFSTHYHLLVDAWKSAAGIRLGHMACMVENQNDEDPTAESITFLYKFIAGNCPRSYGFNTAKLAGIADDVVRTAHKKAREMETGLLKRKAFKDLLAGAELDDARLKEILV